MLYGGRGVLLALSLASVSHAFIGYGIELLNPPCAAACRTRISSNELACSVHDGGSHASWHGHGPAATYKTDAACYAQDTHFLTSMALCLHSGCGPEVPSWDLEKYWATTVADLFGAGNAELAPKWLYGEARAVALEDVEVYGGMDKVPIIIPGMLLNYTGRVEPVSYANTVATNNNYRWAEIFHSRYGLITLTVSVAVPIILTWLGWIPGYHRLADRVLSPYLDMSIFSGYTMRVLPYWLGYAPTIGQACLVVLFFALNVVSTGVDVKTIQPHTMFPSHYMNLLVNLGNRTGVICFALSPLILLLAARNNILLRLTDWSHNTFILLHRWTARVWVLQAVAHSIIELVLYKHQGTYESQATKPYWIWGAAATMGGVALLVTAVTWMRRSHYETFLALHIVLALVTFIGSYYHVYLIYHGDRGYEYWLYACFAIWGGDRLIRVWRIVMTGAHRSIVRELGGGIVRVDIPGVRWPHTPGSHGYVYFPALSWRFWENHPFSVMPTALIQQAQRRRRTLDVGSNSITGSSDVEKAVQVSVIDSDAAAATTRTSTGMTLFVNKGRGLTARLSTTNSLFTCIEGPYHDRSTERAVTADRVVCIAGGVGITGVLHLALSTANAKLYWNVRAEHAGLARELEDLTVGGMEESEVRVGERFDLRAVLDAEAAALRESGQRELGVVVCGPPGLCDEVRQIVTRMGRQRSGSDPSLLLAVESFSW